MIDILWTILCMVACEALTQLSNKAVILDRPRNWLIKKSSFFDGLFQCPYCQSVWMSLIIVIGYSFIPGFKYLIIALCFHRLSNFLHIVFSYIADLQMDLRVDRNRKQGGNCYGKLG
jgi:hypothetical protein